MTASTTGQPSQPLDPRGRALLNMKRVALGCLGAALVGVSLSYAMGGQGGWAWLRAACEAATVGALADWFAVVALFRRPLGLPIWHTAIIPRNKARIADNLANFVRDNFLDPAMLLSKLQAFDPATRLADWLRQPEHTRSLVQVARDLLLDGLDTLDDERLKQAIVTQVKTAAKRWDAASTLAEVLDLLTADGRHQQLLNQGLALAAEWVARDEVKVAVSELLHKHVEKAMPRAMSLLGAMVNTKDMAAGLAQRLSDSAMEEFASVLQRPDHPLRQRYEAELISFFRRLQHDPELRAKIDQLKQTTLADPAVTAYIATLWDDIKQRLRADLSRDDSTLTASLHAGLSQLGQSLAGSSDLRETINQHVMDTAAHLAGHLQGGVTAHIANTIKGWDDRQLVHELELNVGRDLQFIRINGTVVGGLAGLALFAIQQLMANLNL